MRGPDIYRVEAPIPEIEAKAGDIIVNCPIDGLSLMKNCDGKEWVLSTYRSRLRSIPLPTREQLEREEPTKAPPLFITTPPIDGWQ